MGTAARFCTACGASLTAGAKFCGQCGAPVAGEVPSPPPVSVATHDNRQPVGGRRHAIILFVDIAGYTSLSQRLDAEDVHALLAKFFDTVDHLIVDHGGHVDKHIGDAVMAVFGAPVAHDNDAMRAASAALAIHDAMAQFEGGGTPLAVRIGIAGGAVVADQTGSARHREYTVIGEAVNLASRLQGLAQPGETLIDATIESALGAQADTEPCDPVAIKGFDEAPPVWRLRGLRAGGTAPATPFVGRSRQLAQLVGALEDCRAEGYGQTIVVRGEAGMGKTRLVEEFRRRSEQAGFRVATAHILDFGAAAGGDPIRQIAQSLLSLEADADADARRAAIARSIEDGIADAGAESFLFDLLNLPQPEALQPVYDAMSPAARAAGRARALAKLCRRLARRQPLLIVVEDAHWADPSLLSALARLARRMAECPGLLLMTSRLEGDPFDRAWRAEARDAALLVVDLPPLRREEAVSLASAMAQESGGLIDSCIARAEGNPLFLVQLLKSAATASGDLPGTVQSLAQARMDRLDPKARSVLQAAAAIGQRFPIALLRVLDADADPHCATLVDELFLRREGDGYMFAHALIREGVYASLLRAQRRQIHAAIAGWYADRDPALQAEHLERAEDPAAPMAYLSAAQARATALRPDEALGLVRRGLAIATMAGEQGALALLEGELLHDLGQGRDALAAYGRALEHAVDNNGLRCRALLGIAASHRLLSEAEAALRVLEEASSLAKGLGDDAMLGQIDHLRGNLHFALGQAAPCRAAHERALEIARRLGDQKLEAKAWSGLGDADYAVGRWLASAEAFRHCVALAEANGWIRVAEPNRLMLGHCRAYSAQFAESQRLMWQAFEAMRPLNDSYLDMFALESLGIILTLCGDYQAARQVLVQSLALAERVGAKRYEAGILVQLAETELEAGNRERARLLCSRARAIAVGSSFGFVGPAVCAYSALAVDDLAERDSLLAEGEARLGESLAHNVPWFYRAAIEVRLIEGNWVEMEALCARFLDFKPEGEAPLFHRLLVARARAIAAHAQQPGPATAGALEKVGAELAACNIRLPMPGGSGAS